MTLQLEQAKLKYEAQRIKVELETYRLGLIRDGKLPSVQGNELCVFEVGANLRVVPKFNEHDLDTFLLCLRVSMRGSGPMRTELLCSSASSVVGHRQRTPR